jgi:hypothetical protein
MSSRSRLARIAGLLSLTAAAAALGIAAWQGARPSSTKPAHAGHRPAFEATPAVPATFLKQSYAPGELAKLVLWRREETFSVQFFRVAPGAPGWTHTTMEGTAVSPIRHFGATDPHVPVGLRIGAWPSGLYYAQLEADGLTGYAPFVVRPARLGEHEALVVVPTFTWQAYNFRDDDGDGRGDTWYDNSDTRTVRLDRPFMARGVPPHFTTYDLPFLEWLDATGKQVDFLTHGDLGTLTGAALDRAYDVIAFPGHDEYVTAREYAAVTGYRNLGGHLMFLSADDFYWRVAQRGPAITRLQPWRTIGRPETALIGVGLIRNNRGARVGVWKVIDAKRWPWMFQGLALLPGRRFGSGGIEIDHTGPGSPRDITVVAEIRNLIGPGGTAQMTYYETPAGADVFAAGAFTLAGAHDPLSRQLLENLWRHLAVRAHCHGGSRCLRGSQPSEPQPSSQPSR